MNRKAAIQLSLNFLVIIIISLAVFSLGIYIVKKFFTHAENIKMVYDDRTEKEIERLLDDGSKIAIPFDKKTIHNGEFGTFGIGILNIIDDGPENAFQIEIKFNKAYAKDDTGICTDPSSCGPPNTWLKTSSMGEDPLGIIHHETIKNNEQKKLLLGVEPKSASPATYIFDLTVCVYPTDVIEDDATGKCVNPYPDLYDNIHKLYVEVP